MSQNSYASQGQLVPVYGTIFDDSQFRLHLKQVGRGIPVQEISHRDLQIIWCQLQVTAKIPNPYQTTSELIKDIQTLLNQQGLMYII